MQGQNPSRVLPELLLVLHRLQEKSLPHTSIHHGV